MMLADLVVCYHLLQFHSHTKTIIKNILKTTNKIFYIIILRKIIRIHKKFSIKLYMGEKKKNFFQPVKVSKINANIHSLVKLFF